MKNVGVLLIQSSIEDVNLAIEVIFDFLQLYPHFQFMLFVHDNVSKSSFITQETHKQCGIQSHSHLKKFKDRMRSCTLLNASATLALNDNKLAKYDALFNKIATTLNVAKSNTASIKSFSSNSVIWSGHYNPCDGYGSSLEQMVIAMEKADDFNIILKPFQVGNLHLANPLSKLVYNRSHAFTLHKGRLNHAHYILYAQPHQNALPFVFRDKSINFTMWESSRIPPTWPQHMNMFSEVWTPSEWGAEVMRECGVKTKIRVIPLGVNLDTFQYRDPSQVLSNKKFRFLLYANSHWENPRKNYQLTLDAFTKAFGNNKNVELLLKLTTDIPSHLRTNPNVIVMNSRLSTDELSSLLHSAHCFLFISSGEGFSLPAAEAMASGVPTLLSNTSAQGVFAQEKYSTVVQPTGTKVVSGYPPIFGHHKTMGTFDDYTVNSVAEKMLWVYNHYSEAMNRAREAHKYIKSNFTYAHTAQRIKEALDA